MEDDLIDGRDADDLGAQDSLLVGLDLCKKMIWLYHERLFEFLKKQAMR